MRVLSAASGIVLAAGIAFAGETADGGTQGVSEGADGRVRVAQSCGWYAIFKCSKSGNPGGPGNTIWTSDYPNFRPGWYCNVMGPSSKAVANSNANKYGGYAKSAC